jgi:hypothetical protein
MSFPCRYWQAPPKSCCRTYAGNNALLHNPLT